MATHIFAYKICKNDPYIVEYYDPDTCKEYISNRIRSFIDLGIEVIDKVQFIDYDSNSNTSMVQKNDVGIFTLLKTFSCTERSLSLEEYGIKTTANIGSIIERTYHDPS